MVAEPVRDQTEPLRMVKKIRVPSSEEFGNDEFLHSADLNALADELRSRHAMPTEVTIRVLWKAKGGKSGGKLVFGKATMTATGLLGYWAPVDVTIWLAADHLRGIEATPHQIEALLYHELCHVELDEETLTPKLVGHDFTGFVSELEHYGMWMPDLERAGDAFEQAKLIA